MPETTSYTTLTLFSDSLALSSWSILYILASGIVIAFSFILITIAPQYIPSPIKKIIRPLVPFIPRPVQRIIDKYRLLYWLSKHKKLSTREIFSDVYKKGIWGISDDPNGFCSGSGSQDENIYGVYVQSVEKFLKSFETKPNVVDLGCGDFTVGSKIRPSCGEYIACDIVPELIEFNKKKFSDLNVDFRLVDISLDPIPSGDIVFIRQVLQHLSNEDVKNVISIIATNFKYLVLTESVPGHDFTPNLDISSGCYTRNKINSGIDITSTPFNLPIKEEHFLCEVSGSTKKNILIRTILYKL